MAKKERPLSQHAWEPVYIASRDRGRGDKRLDIQRQDTANTHAPLIIFTDCHRPPQDCTVAVEPIIVSSRGQNSTNSSLAYSVLGRFYSSDGLLLQPLLDTTD